jgi:hypothetical protein
MAATTLEARNTGLEQIVKILREQEATKHDVVAPATAITCRNGQIIVKGSEAQLTETGVTSADGIYTPTEVFWGHVADKLKIDRRYLRKMIDAGRTDLLDMNVNGWLQGSGAWGDTEVATVHEPDPRSFLIRLFKGTDGGLGVARGLLSNSYKVTMDNLDVLMAALDGIRLAGVTAQVTDCDLSETRMRVRVVCPEISMLAPDLLTDYRSPFRDGTAFRRAGGGGHGWTVANADGSKPVVSSGFSLTNSPLGEGAYTLTPEVDILECWNGLILPSRAQRRAHLGSRLADGVVEVSDETIRIAKELITSETKDAVASWMTSGYLETVVRQLEVKAGIAVEKPDETVKLVTKALTFSEAEQDGILGHFISGGQLTAGGIMQAVSSFAQTIENPDRAWEVGRQAVKAMDLAAANA